MTGIFSIYSGMLYSDLFMKGIALKTGKVSLKKLQLALKNSQNNIDNLNLVQKCKRIYIIYLVLFYTSLLGAIILIVGSALKDWFA